MSPKRTQDRVRPQQSRFMRWLTGLPRLDPDLPLMWGFTHEREFYIAFLPCILLSVVGLIFQNLMMIVYGLCWFFGCYAIFVLIDSFKRSDTEDHLPEEFKTPEAPKAYNRPDLQAYEKTPWPVRWLVIGLGLVALVVVIIFWPETTNMTVPRND